MSKKSKEKLVPVDAVQEIADKAPQAASIGVPVNSHQLPQKHPPYNQAKHKFKLT